MVETVDKITQSVLFVDVVESTRHFENNEDVTIANWRAFVDEIEASILPSLNGRHVKSTGDGMLLAFSDCKTAVTAAFSIQKISQQSNKRHEAADQMLLRMSIEFCEVVVDRHDFYGNGVLRAERLMRLAGPGEIVVSAHVRDHLVPSLDADVVDLGDCYLKHVRDPVRAYRIGPPGPEPIVDMGLGVGNLFPTIAVIPFFNLDRAMDSHVIGQVMADNVIAALSNSTELNVISRLSTTVFHNRNADYSEIGQYLKANYMLSGTYLNDQDWLTIYVELVSISDGRIVWSSQLREQLSGLFSFEHELTSRIVAEVSKAILKSEMQRANSQPLPTLESYTLLIGAITLMHRLSRDSFEEAYKMLQTLVERATRQSVPYAWLAYWHVLKVQQGWSDDPKRDGQFALDSANRALDANPYSSLSHTIHGFVNTNLFKRLDIGYESYQLALENNPNESLALLLKGTLHAFKGEGMPAVKATQSALKLTPLDPLRFFYDSLAATAFLANHQYEDARKMAEQSVRANRAHTSTLRVLAASQWHLGMLEEAQKTADELMCLQPDLTVSGWLSITPSADYSIGSDWAHVLRQVGIPP